MRRSTRTPFVSISILSPLLFSASLFALPLPRRVFVAPTGSDLNSCSNATTPCQTFAGAMPQVAVGGEILVQATAAYGPLSITQSVSIHAPTGVTAFSCCTVTVNAPGGTVVLRGLTIDGDGAAGNGISVSAVGVLHVESCVITGFSGDGVSFNTAGQLFVKDTIVRNNSGTGIRIHGATTAHASIDHCRLEGNIDGLLVDDFVAATIRDSVVSSQANTGLNSINGAELNIENCVAANNGTAISSSTLGSKVRVSNSTVTDNGTGLDHSGGGSILSRSNNTVEGNTTNGSFSGTFSAK